MMLLHDELHKAAVDARLLLDAHEPDEPDSIAAYIDFVLPSRLRATAALGEFRYDLSRGNYYDQWYEPLLYFAQKHGLGFQVHPSRESTPDGVFVGGPNDGIKVGYSYRFSW